MPTDTPRSAYATDRELASRYKVTRQTIWRWSRSGVLPKPTRFSSGCTRWNLAEVEAREARRIAERDGGRRP